MRKPMKKVTLAGVTFINQESGPLFIIARKPMQRAGHRKTYPVPHNGKIINVTIPEGEQ